jgi:hypothetical protein
MTAAIIPNRLTIRIVLCAASIQHWGLPHMIPTTDIDITCCIIYSYYFNLLLRILDRTWLYHVICLQLTDTLTAINKMSLVNEYMYNWGMHVSTQRLCVCGCGYSIQIIISTRYMDPIYSFGIYQTKLDHEMLNIILNITPRCWKVIWNCSFMNNLFCLTDLKINPRPGLCLCVVELAKS